MCAMREEEIYRNTGKDAMIFEQHLEESFSMFAGLPEGLFDVKSFIWFGS